jgi:hypothetical protein
MGESTVNIYIYIYCSFMTQQVEETLLSATMIQVCPRSSALIFRGCTLLRKPL